ncbi:hypothetical protein BKI52_35160 [marine bacterium AO1-C]|nr:hypothetical protein BKI52_35160 [marine bacterium AO1-C]
MFKYFRNTIIYPSWVLLIIGIIISFVDGYDYKSEWFPPETAIFMNILSVLISLIISIALALPMFLNQFSFVKQRLALSLVTWFCLPLTYLVFIIILFVRNDSQVDFFLISFLLTAFPQTILLGITFDRFRDKLNEPCLT